MALSKRSPAAVGNAAGGAGQQADLHPVLQPGYGLDLTRAGEPDAGQQADLHPVLQPGYGLT